MASVSLYEYVPTISKTADSQLLHYGTYFDNYDYYISLKYAYIDCVKLPTIKDGEFVLDIPGRYHTGAKAILLCNSGFEPKTMAGRVITCLETGIWADSGGTCEPVGELNYPLNVQ